LPVQMSQDRGIAHSKTMPAMTASVQINTTMPIIITPHFCDVVSATWWRKRRIEHFDMLRASTNSIVETKTLICMLSKSDGSKRHPRFPRPESTAVDITTVTPRPKRKAAIMIASSDSGRQ
jgi:hypothetical protein